MLIFVLSVLNAAIGMVLWFYLYKKRNKAAYSPVSMLQLGQAWRSPPSPDRFLPGTRTDPRDW